MGQFEGTQTSQSLHSAPSQYQHLMKLTVKGLHNVIVYIDDLSVHNSDLIIHQASLQSLFDHLQKANLKIKFNKMSLWLYQHYLSWFLFNTCRHFTYIQNFALISSPLNVLTPNDTYRSLPPLPFMPLTSFALDWPLYMAPIAFAYNTALHCSIKCTPFFSLLVLNLVCPLCPHLR